MLVGIFLPAAVAAVALWLALFIPGSRGSRRWAGATALAPAYVVGHVLVAGWPSLPTTEASEWLVYLAAAALVVGLADSLWTAPRWPGWALRLSLCIAVLWFTSSSMREYRWGPIEGALWLAGLTGGMFILWSAIDALALRLGGAILSVQLFGVATATAIVLVLSASAKLAQLSGVLAAAIAGVALIAWWHSEWSAVRATVPAVLVAWIGLLVIGFFYAEVPAAGALLLAAAPLFGCVSLLTTAKRLAPWMTAALAIGLVAIMAGVAVAYTFASQPAASSPSGYEYDYEF